MKPRDIVNKYINIYSGTPAYAVQTLEQRRETAHGLIVGYGQKCFETARKRTDGLYDYAESYEYFNVNDENDIIADNAIVEYETLVPGAKARIEQDREAMAGDILQYGMECFADARKKHEAGYLMYDNFDNYLAETTWPKPDAEPTEGDKPKFPSHGQYTIHRICDYQGSDYLSIYARMHTGGHQLQTPQGFVYSEWSMFLDPYAIEYYDCISQKPVDAFKEDWAKVYNQTLEALIAFKENTSLAHSEATRKSLLNVTKHKCVAYELRKPEIKTFVEKYISANSDVSFIEIYIGDDTGKAVTGVDSNTCVDEQVIPAEANP